MFDLSLKRRDFLTRLIVGGVAASQVVFLLTACQSSSSAATRPDRADNDGADEGADPVEQQQESIEDRAVDEAADSPSSEGDDTSSSDASNDSTELDCTNTEGLSKSEIKVRESLKYTDESPEPDQICENCSLWKPAKTEDTCGGCQIMAGPIHPEGWCTAWAPA